MNCFLPIDGNIGRLVHRKGPGRAGGSIEVWLNESRFRIYFSTVMTEPREAKVTVSAEWNEKKIECVFIPVKEMLANAPGFLSLYSEFTVHFEEIYADILRKAYLPIPRGPRSRVQKRLLSVIEKEIGGGVTTQGETFVWAERQSGAKLEISLLAEGFRKLGLLWLLILNGTLWKGSVLFWDEPEANLNPKLMTCVAEILVELQREGVQVMLATHSLAFLKELELAQKKGDKIRYHALFRDSQNVICLNSSEGYLDLSSNAIAEAMDDLFDRTMAHALAGNKK